MDSPKATRKFHHLVIVRAPGLLPMLYSPSELEQELGVPARTVREWIAKGMPHQRDERNHIWVNGRDFAQWVEQVRTAKKQITLMSDQAFCLRCKQAVQVIEQRRIHRGKLTLIQGACPTCGCTIHRGVNIDQSA